MYDDNVQRHDCRPNHVHPLTSIALYTRKKVLGRRNVLPFFFKPRKWVGTARYGLWDTILPSTPPLNLYNISLPVGRQIRLGCYHGGNIDLRM